MYQEMPSVQTYLIVHQQERRVDRHWRDEDGVWQQEVHTSGVVPQSTRRLFDLARSGQISAAMTLQYQLLHLFDAMIYSADFPAGVWPTPISAILASIWRM